MSDETLILLAIVSGIVSFIFGYIIGWVEAKKDE